MLDANMTPAQHPNMSPVPVDPIKPAAIEQQYKDQDPGYLQLGKGEKIGDLPVEVKLRKDGRVQIVISQSAWKHYDATHKGHQELDVLGPLDENVPENWQKLHLKKQGPNLVAPLPSRYEGVMPVPIDDTLTTVDLVDRTATGKIYDEHPVLVDVPEEKATGQLPPPTHPHRGN